VQAVHAQAIDALAGLGLQRVDPTGERFDPARHEAARVAPAADGVAPGTVVEVHRAGYVDAAGALVRPAVVTVAQAADTSPHTSGQQQSSAQQLDSGQES
jgi:molecular chaperone GrpE